MMKKFCFIAGCARSGTTYLNRLLSQHPGVVGGTETHLLIFMSRMLENYDYQASMGQSHVGLHDWISRDSYKDELREFFGQVTFRQKDPDGRAEVYLEKTPGNARLLPLINSVFEAPLVIHLIRDPVEVVDSMLRASKGWGDEWAPKSLRKATKGWTKTVSRACREGRKMGPCYMELSYDALKREPEVTLANLFERLGLAFDEEIIRRCIESAGDTSDLPQGFVSRQRRQTSLGRLGKWYVRRKARPIIESYNLPIGAQITGKK